MLYPVNVLVDLDSSDPRTNSAWQHKWQIWATLITCINKKNGHWSDHKNTLEPLVLELCVIPLLGVFGNVESSSDVKCSVQGQDQTLKVTQRYLWTTNGNFYDIIF